MAVSTTSQESGIQAEVNYIWNVPDASGDVLQFVTEDEERSTMQTLPGREVWIADARPLATDVDREGFVLVSHASSIDDFDRIQEDPEVDQQYMDEMTELLLRETGATRAFMLGGGKKRYGESAADKLAPLANAKPARYPHADNTDSSATGLVELIAAFVDDLDLEQFSRYALYNMWRAVSAPPQDFPLAVCDARTVAADDEVTITAITEERGAGSIRHDTTGYVYNAAHRWHYYPDMTRDEVIMFKAHDTDERRSGRVPHTAFTDPSCPAGVTTRASVEMRGLALFS
ncbi:MAG TPA: CmcJ/NvfI family oxidoreductase [Acidimicrobiales bacterium]|nr:CmcJ/NvfI family oxidoreductase [Acidimicrobiales bacterium]